MRPRRSLTAYLCAGLLALPAFGACSTTANVSDVYTGLDTPDDKGNTRRRNVFFTDTNEIHCIAQVGVGRPDVTLEAFIHQIRAYDITVPYNENDDGYFVTDRYLGYAEIKPEPKKDGGPVFIDLSLGRTGPDGQPKDDAPFTAGSYVCEIALDGEIKKTAPFNIDFPPCPPAFIIPGGPCLGFFQENKECPKFGILSDDPAFCTCTATKGWECE